MVRKKKENIILNPVISNYRITYRMPCVEIELTMEIDGESETLLREAFKRCFKDYSIIKIEKTK